MQTDDSLRCSFCHQPQALKRKLISSPSDYPRAYICSECVEVCQAIIEDDQPQPSLVNESGEPHPLLSHPLASEAMDCIAQWILQEKLRQPAFEQLNRLRDVATRMIQSNV